MRALVLHPSEKRKPRHRVWASARRMADSNLVTLRFEVECESEIAWGPFRQDSSREAPRRVDGLWKATCFECFATQNAEKYLEWNFAPNGDWAAYGFNRYREGMSHVEVAAPEISRISIGDSTRFEIDFSLPENMQTASVAFSLTSVIFEQGDSNPYYWALVHSGSKPDFHLRESFILELEY